MTREIKEAQYCVSTQPWFTIEVPSQSTPNLIYEVLVPFPDDPPTEFICSCQGYVHRGHCRHQAIAFGDLCGWKEGDEETQSEDQKTKHICPRCWGDTYEVAEIV